MHFNNHENLSAEIWKKKYPKDILGYEIIKNDMVFHKSSALDFDLFLKDNEIDFVLNLGLIAIAELRANTEFFGGKNSDSYKIKYKKIMSFMKKVNKKIINT